ncbi:MAG: hypothetical protein WDW36_000123 [Sanguina aurantia]
MGKNDFMSPKDIANRIKAKGLSKLRWYCQLCQKQCRDENGFKCHQGSESHQRQMELFGESAERVVAGFSEDFEATFLQHLATSHPRARVSAKVVYNEYINDKNHIHMNATIWLTLSDFVKYLGKEGKCRVEDTPKGWFITLVASEDAFEHLNDERRIKRAKHEQDEEERHMEGLNAQVNRAHRHAGEDAGASAATDLIREEGQESRPLTLRLQSSTFGATTAAAAAAAAARAGAAAAAAALGGEEREGGGPSSRFTSLPSAFGDDEGFGGGGSSSANAGGGSRRAGSGTAGGPAHPLHSSKPLSGIDSLMRREMNAQRDAAARAAGGRGAARPDPDVSNSNPDPNPNSNDRPQAAWVVPGIVVKVMSKALTQHGYYKQKGVICRVVDAYLAEVEMSSTGDVVRVDQAELETVIPAPGGSVMLLGKGSHAGMTGELVAVDTARFQAQVRLQQGPSRGSLLWVEYEDVSKLAAAAASR